MLEVPGDRVPPSPSIYAKARSNILTSPFAGPKAEEFVFIPVAARPAVGEGGGRSGGDGAGGLLKVQCPPAMPTWQCPGFKGQCLTVMPAPGPPPPPPQPTPPTADAAGALTLYFGANQMWGLRDYNRSRCTFNGSSSTNISREECVRFQGSTTFPRRLGIGGITVSPSNRSALVGATFTAEMHVATAEVRASLVVSPGGQGVPPAHLTVHVVLDPDENVAVTTITSNPPMEITITTWALPLGSSLPQPCTPTDDPSVPGCLDGTVAAGVDGETGVFWSQRQPLSAKSSRKPISIAMASAVLPRAVDRGGGAGARTSKTSVKKCVAPASTGGAAAGAACVVAVAGTRGSSPLQIATVLMSNLDLCPDHDTATTFVGSPPSPSPSPSTSTSGAPPRARTPRTPCTIDPLNAARARVATVSAAAVAAANKRWWEVFWNTTFVEIPADPTLEQFYYAHSYLIGSASRAGKVAAGLWGPWVHGDSPEWAGDFTLDYNHEANHWGLYAREIRTTPRPRS